MTTGRVRTAQPSWMRWRERRSTSRSASISRSWPKLRCLASWLMRKRAWRRLRVLSSAGTTYNHDYFGEDAEGAQRPMLNVFRREGDGIRHFWGSELLDAPAGPGEEARHVDPI